MQGEERWLRSLGLTSPARSGCADAVGYLDAGGVSQPTAATVYVDDRPLGQTPLTLVSIEPGVRLIRLELEGHPVWSSSVRVGAGSREKLLAVFEPPVRH